jgi:abortive infection bacteriophage resistance protein
VGQQVELLRGRGMAISDTPKAETCLHRIGYYRLSGYAYPFRQREIRIGTNGRELELIHEQFRPHTEFSTIMDLYVFDKKLRLLFLDAIERIEVGLRVEVALILGTYGAYSYRDPATFNSYFSVPDAEGVTPHTKFIEKLDLAFRRSREEFAEHFRSKYSSDLPIWMSIELWDFGTLSTVLNGMKSVDLDKLSGLYQLPKRRFLPSWVQSINFVRNICAHHGRLWNRPIVQQPSPSKPGELFLLEHLTRDQFAQRRLYAVAAVLQYLLNIVHPGSTWKERLHLHTKTLPDSPHISTRHMGFPLDWEKFPLWV